MPCTELRAPSKRRAGATGGAVVSLVCVLLLVVCVCTVMCLFLSAHAVTCVLYEA